LSRSRALGTIDDSLQQQPGNGAFQHFDLPNLMALADTCASGGEILLLLAGPHNARGVNYSCIDAEFV